MQEDHISEKPESKPQAGLFDELVEPESEIKPAPFPDSVPMRESIAGTRICKKCGKRKPIEDFALTVAMKGTLCLGRKYRRHQCEKCIRERDKARQLRDPARYRYTLDAMNKRVKRRRETLEGWAVHILKSLKQRAKDKNLPFALTAQNILELFPKDGLCPIMKTKLVFGVETCRESASVDRLIPENGYVIGNLSIISHFANSIKNNATWQEVRAVADWMESRFRESGY